MSRKDASFEELLPIELKLLLVQAELDRLDSDARWIEQRRQEILREIDHYKGLLSNKRRQAVLRRVK